MQGALPITEDILASPFRFLWHTPTRTAILADLHLGGQRSLATAGISLPDVYFSKLLASWKQLIAANPVHIVLAGDLFDAAATASATLDQFHALLADIPPGCAVTLTPGNHDPAPEALQKAFPAITVTPFIHVGDAVVTHGHVLHPAIETGHRLIVGHQHPAITFNTRVHSAKMHCFAHAPNLILLPPFSPLPLGSNLLRPDYWILDLPRPADVSLRIAGIIEKPGAEQVLDFGPLSGLG